MATHYSILAWRIPWTEDPGGLCSMESWRVEHDGATNTFTPFTSLLRLCWNVGLSDWSFPVPETNLYWKETTINQVGDSGTNVLPAHGHQGAQVPLIETFLGIDKNLMWFFFLWRTGPLDTMLYSNPIILGLSQNIFQQHILVNKWMFIFKKIDYGFFFF